MLVITEILNEPPELHWQSKSGAELERASRSEY
jgi:hypothetical protein